MASSVPYSAPMVVGAGGSASDVTLEQLNIQQLFVHDDARDDIDDQDHANMMHMSSAQLVYEDKRDSTR